MRRTNGPGDLGVHFSDFFEVSTDDLHSYGAFNISLVNDLPLFVDPFLLFNADKAEYQRLHTSIIHYMRFLRDAAIEGIEKGLLEVWFRFPEVKQNWLGFSLAGNEGHGLGGDFADALGQNLRSTFSDFGEETVTNGSHIEKLSLVRRGVGRDNISDFTTNLIKEFLAEYTQTFAIEHIDSRLRKHFSLEKVRFNYETRSWMRRTYDLPCHNEDFVLLTPKDILTKDESWINRAELLDRLPEIAVSLPDEALRAQVNDYLRRVLPVGTELSRKEQHEIAGRVIQRFPQVLDYYIRVKEEHGDRASSVAKQRVAEVEAIFVEQVRQLVSTLHSETAFYQTPSDTYDEARRRLLFLKDVIENKGGHHIFYVNGRPIGRESDLQILYRLTWFATLSDISREVNDGRGPADFKVSKGAHNKTLVEFKLAKNSHLERNLAKQSAVYEAASDATQPSLKAITYFSEAELDRTKKILKKLGLSKSSHVVLIDARADNKPSGSRA